MHNFDNGVPFDPGYEKFYTVFPENIQDFVEEIKAIKSIHKVKFELGRFESKAVAVITQIAGVHHGCMLWGAYIHNKFKDSPQELIGNSTLELSEDEMESVNYSKEVDLILEFISKFDKDTKYFLKKPFKLDKNILEIINSYKEFVKLNNHFKELKNTKDIKLPEKYSCISEYTPEKLEKIYEKIKITLNSDDINNIF